MKEERKKNRHTAGKEGQASCIVTGMENLNPGPSQSQRRALDGDPNRILDKVVWEGSRGLGEQGKGAPWSREQAGYCEPGLLRHFRASPEEGSQRWDPG